MISTVDPFPNRHYGASTRGARMNIKESETRARKGGNPEYPTGTGSSVNL